MWPGNPFSGLSQMNAKFYANKNKTKVRQSHFYPKGGYMDFGYFRTIGLYLLNCWAETVSAIFHGSFELYSVVRGTLNLASLRFKHIQKTVFYCITTRKRDFWPQKITPWISSTQNKKYSCKTLFRVFFTGLVHGFTLK